MIKYSIELNMFSLEDLREIAQNSPRAVSEFVSKTLKPLVEEQVKLRLAVTPPPRSGPFRFNTPRSKTWFISKVRQGAIKMSGGHYIRTGAIERGWAVRIDRRRSDENVLVVSNNASDANNTSLGRPPTFYGQIVYGPRPVMGHTATGWGANFTNHYKAIAEKAEESITNFWVSYWNKGR